MNDSVTAIAIKMSHKKFKPLMHRQVFLSLSNYHVHIAWYLRGKKEWGILFETQMLQCDTLIISVSNINKL